LLLLFSSPLFSPPVKLKSARQNPARPARETPSATPPSVIQAQWSFQRLNLTLAGRSEPKFNLPNPPLSAPMNFQQLVVRREETIRLLSVF